MKSLDSKKKILWKQIYKNAVDDRSSALMLFTEVYGTMAKTSTDHVALGSTLVKYLEKMSKSNQQLIDLSNLITRDETESSKFDTDDVFNQIGEAEDE